VKVDHLTPVLNVASVPESIAWFEKLGWERSFTWNDGGMIVAAGDSNEHGPADFGGVCSGSTTLFMCQDGQGQRGAAPAAEPPSDDGAGGMWMSLWLDTPADVDAAHARAVEAGITVTMPPADEPWGVRECRIMHPDGHVFRISSGLDRG
jgi:uncharacterized glyoxalase superfamily protein PhnB